MTIRSKLNLAVVVLVIIFLISSGFAMRAVGEHARYTRTYTRMRDLEQLTASIHAGIYRYVATTSGKLLPSPAPESAGWLEYALRDIATQTRLGESAEQRELWSELRQAVTALGGSSSAGLDAVSSTDAVRKADRSLRALRNRYQMAEADLISTAADKSLAAQQAIWLGGALTILLFLGYVILVRNWLVQPIEVLKSAADAIGEGRHEGRIPLTGHDELAQLARRIETMTARLAARRPRWPRRESSARSASSVRAWHTGFATRWPPCAGALRRTGWTAPRPNSSG